MSEASTGGESLTPFTAVLGDQRHEIYATLAARGTVHPITLPAGAAGWLVTGYIETRALLSDPRLVKGGWRSGAFADKLPEDVARGTYMTMLHTDPPAHTRLRKLVTSAFTRRRVEKLAPRIQRMADDLLTEADDAGPVDLISVLAYPLPINVICELIGIPEEDRADFRAWTQPAASPGIYSLEEYQKAVTSLLEYGRGLIEKRRSEPQDDLLSDLIAARDDGDGLTEDELTSMIFVLLLAGHETTVNLIANGVRALLTHPDQLDLLRRRPELLEPAVEEILRHDGPVQNTLPYRTTEPVQVGGITLPEGATVLFALMAANRDDEHFSSSATLDIARGEQTHIAFGHGIHYCLGAPLARIEARIAFRTLLDRFPALRLAEPAHSLTRVPSMILNGLSELPVYLR
ncbi:cytochrome P450 [Streptomyces parvulus]|uniref:Cytochrome P450 n=1 Tax=Streptomyces parvulus TaxID=146923 RepID=A0A369UYN3_9ACTN|nr:cytochrome P450 [Streptomyces parvulus]RDD85115.1 cytochrome P450 [Streptomyces parvulus]